MIQVHYGVVRISGSWAVIAEGLRLDGYQTEAEAEQVARRMADQAAGLTVQLHLQGERGELRLEAHRSSSDPEGSDTAEA